MDKVKIGLTTRTSETRAIELSTTSLPSDFIVVYDEFVSNCDEVEQILHKKFEDYRVNKRREFFHIPIKEAIKALQEISKNFQVNQADISEISIFGGLKHKYPNWLKPDIIEIKIANTHDICFLETVRRPHSTYSDEIIEKIDLSFIIKDEDELFFPATNSVEENADLFVNEFDEISIIHCTNIFTESAISEIAKNWNSKSKSN